MIEQKLEEETEKMDRIRAKRAKQERSKNDILSDYIDRCIPELDPILTGILNDEKQVKSLITSAKIDETESEQWVQQIRQFLKNGQFTDVALYIIKLDALVGQYDKWKTLRINEQVLYFVTLLQTYLFDDYVSKITTFLCFISIRH